MNALLKEFIGPNYKNVLLHGMLAGMLAGCLLAMIVICKCEGWL